jgi:NAD(P) transhydrogenase subunit beta
MINALYIIASILFIYGLKMLGNQKTARKGNMLSSLGMLIAIVAALLSAEILHWEYIVIAIALGSFVGVIASQRVAMTSMPQMVALFNGFGGIASLLVGWAEFQKFVYEGQLADQTTFTMLVISLAILVGAVTFTGSLVAYGKLTGKISSKPVLYTGQQFINVLILLLILVAIVFFSLNIVLPIEILIFIIVGVSLLYGILFVIPIGGGDMPVVISLLNSFSGVAACITGFVVSNNVLIVAGALVGSSGLILTQIMTKAMNRKLGNVLFSGFGAPSKTSSSNEDLGDPNPINVEDAYYILEAATNVLIVPGYGMAVAQAQHVVRELAGILVENGAEVNYAIHPVAGRMPGHMNVLLAEANVDYDQLREMDDVNPTIEQVDLAIIIGANDVVNPAAREDESSPIYGMPIIDVDKARTTIVLKRSMSPGYAGIENPLFYKDNTRMLFGDAKKSVQGLVAEFKN